MKKLLLVFPIVVLLAAGCNSSRQVYNQTPVPKPVTQNIESSPIINSTSTPNVPAGWLTYSYKNFSFEYPSDYTVEFQNKGTPQEFLTIRSPDLWISVEYYNANPSLDSSDITKYLSGFMLNNDHTHYDLDTPVAGQKTLHITGWGSSQSYDYDDYHFLKDGKYYRLDFSYHNNKTKDQKIRDTFIQNFKFNAN